MINVHVVSIEPRQQPHIFDVGVLIGHERFTFTFRVEVVPVDSGTITVVRPDKGFAKTFQFSPDRKMDIYQLVRNAYDGHPQRCPVDIGVFDRARSL